MRKLTVDELGRLSPDAYAASEKLRVSVVLDNVRSMFNVGSFFRTCDSFSVERIILCGITATPPDKEIHKTALGAEETVSWSYAKTTEEAVAELQADGYTVIAVEQTEDSIPLQDFRCQEDARYALVFGNEVFGVGQSVVDMCGMAIEIPQAGTKHSLNVSVAGGVVLWHFFQAMKSYIR
jgi:tRNA G18 (ribose-2'-O)-methylase SpoU